MGTKPHIPGETISWPVSFASGMLKAVGKKGSVTTSFELTKAGPAAKIALQPDVLSLKAGGRDLAQIEVDVCDNAGVLVPEAENLITCAVIGPGRIIGIENGNLGSTESYQSQSHQVYQGRMLVYLQSLKTAGEIQLTASAPNLEESKITLPVR